jgi:hypothetical protein
MHCPAGSRRMPGGLAKSTNGGVLLVDFLFADLSKGPGVRGIPSVRFS